MNELVSIIIPVHDAYVRYLPQALNSIFSQDYPFFEVIIVDDGSTVNFRSMLDPYGRRIRYIRQKNAGPASARNRGLGKARGEYICFLDADDFFLPGKLPGQMALFVDDPNLGAVHSGWQRVNQAGDKIGEEEPWHYAPVLDFENFLIFKPILMGPMIVRQKWLVQMGGQNPSLRQVHDIDLVLRMARAGCKFSWFRKQTIGYRFHENNISRNAMESCREREKLMDGFFSSPDLPDAIRLLERKSRYGDCLWCSWHMFRTGHLDKMIPVLKKAFAYSTWTCPMDTIFAWANQFYEWTLKYGVKQEKLQLLWPYFNHVFAFENKKWQQIERLLKWWISRNIKSLKQYRSLDSMWHVFQRIETFEKDINLSVEKMMDWRVDVWRCYQSNDFNSGLQGLSILKGLTTRQIVCLVKLFISIRPEVTTSVQVRRLWHDLLRQNIVPESDKLEIAGLYLSVFGQAALDRKWKVAAEGMESAFRIGFQTAALKHWYIFITNAISCFYKEKLPVRKRR